MVRNGSAWTVRRIVNVGIAIAMLFLAFAAHPPALEASELPVSVVAHVHERQPNEIKFSSHHGLHHDHHAQMTTEEARNLLAAVVTPAIFTLERKKRGLTVSFERPPRSAWR